MKDSNHAATPADWTPDAELARYANARHPHSNSLGELEVLFAEPLRALSFDLSFDQDRYRDVGKWRRSVLPRLRKALRMPARRCLSGTRLLSRTPMADVIREEIEFRCQTGSRIPATVLVPRTGKPPFPAVAVLHDMGDLRPYGREKMLEFDGEPSYLTEHRRVCYEGRSVCLDLARRGFLTICIDALIFGERAGAVLPDPAGFLQERGHWSDDQASEFSGEMAFHWDRAGCASALLTGQTWAGLIAQEDIATVDYLVARPDVDPRRIGCVGLSFGAYRSHYLAALDKRLAAAVSGCWLATVDSVIGYNVRGAMGFFTLIPGINEHLDICDIPALACPRPFMAISGWRDPLMHPFGIAAAHRKLRRVWSKAGAAQNLGSLCFDAPHELNALMQERAWEWLSRQLNPRGVSEGEK